MKIAGAGGSLGGEKLEEAGRLMEGREQGWELWWGRPKKKQAGPRRP